MLGDHKILDGKGRFVQRVVRYRTEKSVGFRLVAANLGAGQRRDSWVAA